MKRYGMVLLAIGLFFFASQAKADDKTDKEKFQGEWSLVTLEENGEGQKITEESDHYVKLKIEGDKFMVGLKNGDHDATFLTEVVHQGRPHVGRSGARHPVGAFFHQVLG